MREFAAMAFFRFLSRSLCIDADDFLRGKGSQDPRKKGFKNFDRHDEDVLFTATQCHPNYGCKTHTDHDLHDTCGQYVLRTR